MENKKGIIVGIFFIFIIVSVFLVATLDFGGDKKKETDEISDGSNVQESNLNETVDDSSYDENLKSDESEQVIMVTSNFQEQTSNIQEQTSNSNSTSTSNNSNKTKGVPISYFITEVTNNKIYVGGKTYANVTIYPNNATIQNISYSSSNPSVVIASKDGTLYGISPGVSDITIKVEGAGVSTVRLQVLSKSSISNSIIPSTPLPPTVSSSPTSNNSSKVPSSVAVSSISISQTKLTLQQGSSATITASVLPSNASNKTITWTSDNPAIASVSGGKITGLKTGTTIIRAHSSNGKSVGCVVVVNPQPKNGWYTEGGKKYYYVNGQIQRDTYVNYIYLDANGVAQDKIGTFSATLYGARAWANQKLNIRQQGNGKSAILGTVPEGAKMKIVGGESGSYIKIEYGGQIGYVYSNYIFINLPDIIPDVIYDITNAYSSIFKAGGKNIPGITGQKLYRFNKEYNAKIGKSTFYAPLLYPVAKKFQNAYNLASKNGRSFKVYDTYRPRPVEELVTAKYKALYNSDSAVKKMVDYDSKGNYWGWTWFMTKTGTSRHCQAIALDLALTDRNGNELAAQSTMHTLDTRSLYSTGKGFDVNRELSSYMTQSGFSTLKSEWWHYEDNTYENNAYETFYIS